MVAKLGADFVPVLVEKDDEPKLIARYGLEQFPTIVWSDASGEALMLTFQPECADEALRDLDQARTWLREATADEKR